MTKLKINDVPEKVKENVANYLQKHNLGELVLIRRASEHPEDDYIYHVVARKKNRHCYFHNGEWNFSCWTCWNETTQCLNYGHYDLESVLDACEILNKYYRTI